MGFRRAKSTQGNTNCQKIIFEDDQVTSKILRETKPDLKLDKSDSAITRHLKKRPTCIKDDLHSRFKILATARSDKHLEALEAAFINALKPDLCQQKVFGKLASV